MDWWIKETIHIRKEQVDEWRRGAYQLLHIDDNVFVKETSSGEQKLVLRSRGAPIMLWPIIGAK